MMHLEWFDDDDDDPGPSIWSSPPRPGTPETWLELFGRMPVTIILCPESIIGGVCASLRIALTSDPERMGRSVVIVPPTEEDATMFVSRWVGEVARDVGDRGVDIFIVIPERRTCIRPIDERKPMLERLGPYAVMHQAGRIVELSLNEGMESVCLYRIVKDAGYARRLFDRIPLLG